MIPELLAPAGDPECLETALYFGADAVYVGLRHFGLRAFAENFTYETLAQAVGRAHRLGRRVYVALNALLRPEDLPRLTETLAELERIGPDALIFADPAVLMSARALGTEIPMHLSTQLSTMNAAACRFWMENGVRRIVLARELSLREIATIRSGIPAALELEAFVHGAMCVAHSGRCLLSSVMTGRSGNDGRCAQPCRWRYELSEVGGDGRRFPVQEDGRGTYILNSKDLMMLRHLGALREAGVDSLKIEGRNKSVFYVASAVSAYRRALNALAGTAPADLEQLEAELLASSSRQAGTGFYFGGEEREDRFRSELPRRYTFVAKVTADARDGVVPVEQRNKFALGERLEVLSPHLTGAAFTLHAMTGPDGGPRRDAPHPQEPLELRCALPLRRGDLLRRLDG